MSGAHSVTWWGSFDPYTFGCWLSEDKIHDLPDPEEADRLLLRTLVQRPDEQHIRYLEGLSADERAVAYTLFTAYTHEWRHWFDLTSTAFGLFRTAQLAAFFATVSQLDDVIRAAPTVFVPLHRWVREHELISAVHPHLGPPSADIGETVTRAHTILRKADTGMAARAEVRGTVISTAQILEALAMLTQESEAARAFGPAAADVVRRSIRRSEAGDLYYTAIDVLEDAGCTDPGHQTIVLDATLAGDYAAYGTDCPFTPPFLLAALIDNVDLGASERLGEACDHALRFTQGVDRFDAFDRAYTTATTFLDKIADSAAEETAGATIRATLAVALRNAFLWGGAARHADTIGEDAAHGPAADPYSFFAPIFVEGYPGRLESVPPSPWLTTLAGVEFASLRIAAEALPKVINPTGDPDIDDNPVRLSAVWTVLPENPEEAPDYYAIFNIFRDLMYWRGLLFGRRSLSPFTAWFTVDADSESLGQTWIE